MAEYKVELDVYNGPLDLLLYLIRRDEVDIYDIPIAQITEQYLAYVKLIERIDPNLVAEFLVMAATLIEIKSRTLLPRPPVEEEEEDFGDPRLELVHQLLEYKKYKDAAHQLSAAMEIQALKHQRVPAIPDLGEDEVDLDEVQIWDLFDAFQNLLAATGQRSKQHEVLYDDTPIALHAADVLDSLQRTEGVQEFKRLFEGRTKSQLIGLFLAVLELVRQRRVRAVQTSPFAPIELHLLDASPISVNEDVDYRSLPKDEDDEELSAEAEPDAVEEEFEAEDLEDEATARLDELEASLRVVGEPENEDSTDEDSSEPQRTEPE